MKPESKKQILQKLMQKVPLIYENRLRSNYFVRQPILQSPIHCTTYIASTLAQTINYSSNVYYLVPGFKVNNQSTYKLHGSSGRKYQDKSCQITNFKTQPSFSLNSTISKIYLSPRPTKKFKYKRYAETQKNFPRRTLVIKSKKEEDCHQSALWNLDRWDTIEDRNENKSFIF